MVAIGPLGSRLDLDRQASPVVLAKRRGARSSGPVAGADTGLKQVRQPPPIADPSGVGQKMAHRGPETRFGRNQPKGPKVIVGGRVQLHQPPLAQLHHRDRRERLSDRPDPEHRVLRDRLLRFNVRDTMAEEPLERSVAHENDSEAGGRPAVQRLGHLGLHIEFVDRSRRAVRLPGRRLLTRSFRQTLTDLHQTRLRATRLPAVPALAQPRRARGWRRARPRRHPLSSPTHLPAAP